MKDGKVGFGILGLGAIGPLHAQGVQASKKAYLAAVCDLKEDLCRKYSEQYKAKYYTRYNDMLADKDVDIISICTPPGTHLEQVQEAAAAKKHLLVEKPIEVTLERIDKLIAACRAGGVKLGGIFQKRAFPDFIRIKKAIDEGVIGKLILVDAYLKYYRAQAYYDSPGWRGTYAMDGGGTLMAQGTHGIDLVNWMAGGAESVKGYCGALARRLEAEDTAVAIVKYKCGAFGVIEGTTSVTPGGVSEFAIHGTRGTIKFNENGITEWAVAKDDGEVAEDDQSRHTYSEKWHPGHFDQIDDMADAVLHDRAPAVTGEEARKAVALVLGIYESSKTGREIQLEP
jgi:predicted dehydrogenase